VDREIPPEAGHVPVQLVMLVEEAEHAAGTIAVRVGVYARRQQAIRRPEPGAHAVPPRLAAEGLGVAVAQDRNRLVDHLDVVAETVLVARGVIAVDAAPDALPFGPDRDRLGHFHRRVRTDQDVASVFEDAFVRGGTPGEQREKQEGGGPHREFPRSTRGRAATSSASFWKSWRGSKPNERATKLLGTLARRVLYSRTAPL